MRILASDLTKTIVYDKVQQLMKICKNRQGGESYEYELVQLYECFAGAFCRNCDSGHAGRLFSRKKAQNENRKISRMGAHCPYRYATGRCAYMASSCRAGTGKCGLGQKTVIFHECIPLCTHIPVYLLPDRIHIREKKDIIPICQYHYRPVRSHVAALADQHIQRDVYLL